ncbi:MAG TPA: ATP synthase F0 subunit B [Firmicutes bacterium]|jgi:cell division septum initiation protein DivIVA|nr:ATP synthase F0 subunit B [Bacillota bacterium]
MDVLALLDRLDTYVSECSRLPLVGKLLVDEDEVFGLIDDLRAAIPHEFEQAKWLLKERDRIVQEARREADEIIKDAQGQIAQLASESVITKEARIQAEELVDKAQAVAGEIHMGARLYADDLMKNIEALLTEMLDKVRINRKELNVAEMKNPDSDQMPTGVHDGNLPEGTGEADIDEDEDDDDWNGEYDGADEFQPRKRLWFRGRD